jgi:DNA-directed RNA polymerase subunit K/omega
MTDEHPEVKPIFRKEVIEAVKHPRETRPYFTKYEYVHLLAVRTQQLAEGAKPLVSLDGLNTSDPRLVEKLAKREIEQRKLPFLVNRIFPDKDAEKWSVQELEIMW